jgi:hypothetical protein
MADAVECVGGVGGEVERPAGDAIELEKMKSSMFIASGSGVFERSTDLRSWAIPEGAFTGCWLALGENFISALA